MFASIGQKTVRMGACSTAVTVVDEAVRATTSRPSMMASICACSI